MATATTKKPESKYLNSTRIEKLLEDAKGDLSEVSDVVESTRILKRNWVDTVRDLRLLHREKELFTLVRIPEKLLKWLSEECTKTFADDSTQGLLMFLYSYDMDKNGIVYHFATNGGSRAWKNPGLGHSPAINVRFSSIMHDSQPAVAVLARQTVRCVTKPEKNSWFIVDFRPKMIRPTHYTLRHYSTWDTEALRCWEFQASADGGQTWKKLMVHKNDSTLNTKGSTGTWALFGVDTFYSMFRVLQTDFNSNRHYYLAVSGFEIYGAMKEGNESGVPFSQSQLKGSGTLTFIQQYDFDTHGIIYWLGTNRGTAPWKNPQLRGLCKVTQSSLAKDSHPSYAVVGRECVRCVSEPKKNSWFTLDLATVSVIPTAYTLKHYASFDTECLRNWRFEAQNASDKAWVLLIKHINDTSLSRKGASHTWPIPANVVNGRSFSKYRLFQYGVNSNQHHYLSLSGFELYGTVTKGMNSDHAKSESKESEAPPSQATRSFVHRGDLDCNGLLYFLGVQGGLRLRYSNPAEIGMCAVTSSSLMSDSTPLISIVGRLACRCVTKPHQRSWMAINLKNVCMKLSKYTLRHYNSWDTEALRYWNLEGSKDGISWVAIRQHMDDRALRKAGLTHTWAVDTNAYYSHFRIYMTGRNSNNHWYLACSGCEFYGEAYGGIVSQRANADITNLQNAAPLSPNSMNAVEMFPPPPPAMGAAMGGGMLPPANANNANSSSVTFDYVRDLDHNGICYFLGTKCGSTQWTNPCEQGAIEIKSSGVMHDSKPLSCCVGMASVRCVTKPLKNAWISLNFLDYAICPSHYTIRHYCSWDTEALRNWRLEASLDGEHWQVLREHHNDESLKYKGQGFTWQIGNCNRYFSIFRIFQFDKNSNNHYYLSISGFELYGKVVRQHSTLRWDEWPRNKSKHLQVDRYRNTVMNVGSDDTWQTCKSRQALDFTNTKEVEFAVLVERSQNTTNSWKFMTGIAPDEFKCTGSRQWLGSQASWAYVGGTGGKCYNNGKSLTYGSKWGEKAGDLVFCVANIQTKSIEFICNGKSQGKAFDNFDPKGRNSFAAVSITASGSRIRLCERVTPNSKPPIVNSNANNANAQPAAQQPPISIIQPIANNPNLNNNNANNNGWDQRCASSNLAVFPDGITVTNKGSNDTWQCICAQAVFSDGKHSFDFQLVNDTKTSNQWKFIVGVVPVSYDPKKTAWLGSQESWGYIAGTGGKCHKVGKSIAYGKRYGGNDCIRCVVDFNKRTIEFFRNNKSQGIAFSNLNGAVRPAVSLTGKGAAIKICNIK